MKKYNNYQPEIPLGDDPGEEFLEPNIPTPEVQSSPSRRRRNRMVDPEKKLKQESLARQSRQQQNERKPAKSKSFGENIREWLNSSGTRVVSGIVLGGCALWLAFAFFSYFANCVVDQSLVESRLPGGASDVVNDAGEGGARLTELLINQGFGIGSFVLVVWLLCMSLKLLVGYPRFRTLDFTIKSLIAFITISVVVGMLSIGFDTDVNWGGMHGRIINEWIYGWIGWSGAIILSSVLIALFVVICLRDAIKWILKKKRAYDEKKRIAREEMEEQRRKDEELREMKRRELEDEAKSGEGEVSPDMVNPEQKEIIENVDFDPEDDTIFDIPDLDDYEESSLTDKELITNLNEADDEADDIESNSEETDCGSITNPSEIPPASSDEENTDPKEYAAQEDAIKSETFDQYDCPVPNDDLNEDMSETSPKDAGSKLKEEVEEEDVMTVNLNQIEKGQESSSQKFDEELFTHEYKFPSTDFLMPGKDKISVNPEEQRENNEKIRKVLLDFGIAITSIEATVGPTVTLYEIKPDTGVKIARIRSLSDDIALAVAAEGGVRIIAPIPGRGTVGIEIGNKEAQMVSMRTIIQSKNYQEAKNNQESKYELPIALGATISNDVYIGNLAKMPHLLVAGATGQGKSVGLNAIITSLLYSKRPEELKFVMVDPKRVEFSLYSKIENYYLAKIPDSQQAVITKMENVVATLNSLCIEMDERYKLLEKSYVRQIGEYNAKFREKKLNPKEGHRFLPYIVVVIDEFADLIMTAGKEVELPIARLAQLARAVGIHVIIATQRPSTNVITGMIKANFPVRIAFKVSSGIDSKTILDATGAQQLIGRGDMLISNNGVTTRVQCAFVDTPEVEEICDYISRQPYPQGPYLLPEPQMEGSAEGTELTPSTMGKKDPLLAEVATSVVMAGSASTSAVQRSFEIGFNRAGRIMDQLEALGIVGPAQGGKARTVLVDPLGLEDILRNLQ